eukprot:COSAG03_NODE_14855_length_449_cov_7.080000_1_plen_20_part_01
MRVAWALGASTLLLAAPGTA